MELIPYEVYSNHKATNIKPKASLIVAIYNNINFFDIVFASIEAQSFKNFELIICDDGSKLENSMHVREALKKTKLLAKYVWHEDRGFRKNEILNKGIIHSESDYIIFIDQDCVLHPEFVYEHIESKKENKILSGRSMELSPFITKLITPRNVSKGFIQKNLWWLIPAIVLRKDNQGDKGIYIKNLKVRKLLNRKHRGVVGRNFSVHKINLENINGFDMRYHGVGIGEDSDIEYRLNLSGVETLSFCNSAVQYHLYHPYLPRKNNNEQIFNETMEKKIMRTEFGLDKISLAKIMEIS